MEQPAAAGAAGISTAVQERVQAGKGLARTLFGQNVKQTIGTVSFTGTRTVYYWSNYLFCIWNILLLFQRRDLRNVTEYSIAMSADTLWYFRRHDWVARKTGISSLRFSNSSSRMSRYPCYFGTLECFLINIYGWVMGIVNGLMSSIGISMGHLIRNS